MVVATIVMFFNIRIFYVIVTIYTKLWEEDFMEFITEKLLNILACAETTQLERMKLKLGL